MAYTNPKPLLEEIAFARKQYERSLEAGDTAAADRHFSRVMDLKEGLAKVEKANEQHNLRFGTQETIDDIRQRAAVRELRIQLGDAGEASTTKPNVTGSGFRKPKGGVAPDFVPFEILKQNAEAAKAKLAAEAAQKAALGEVEQPKLATPKSAIDIIREAKEKKFGRVTPSTVPPKSNTANIVPRQEAIDEARALEEQARLKAIADKEAFEQRRLEREASRQNKEEIKKNKDLLKEAKRLAAEAEAAGTETGTPKEKTPRQVAAATTEEILGGYKPKLAQPAAEPVDTSASIRETEAADAEALEKEQARVLKEKQKINGRHISNYGTTALEEMDKAPMEKIATPKKKKGESAESWDERLKQWKDDTDRRAEQRQLVKDELSRRSGNADTRARQAAVDKELKAQAKAEADAAVRRTLERQGLGMANSLDEAAPTSNTSTLRTPKPVPTAAPQPVVSTEPQLSEKELRRQALMRQLAELDAPEPPKLAGATETVTTPEGLTITRPVAGEPAPAPSGLTPEQLQSLAEAEEFDRQRGQRPVQKGRIDNTPKQAGNPPRQTPPSRPGFAAVPSLETMGNVADKTIRGLGLAAYGVGVAQHGPVEMAVGYGVPFTPWRYGVGPTDIANAPERDPYAAQRAADPEFGLTVAERQTQANIRQRQAEMLSGNAPTKPSMLEQPKPKNPMPKTQDYSELFKNSELFKIRK